VHIHEITPGFPVYEHFQARLEQDGGSVGHFEWYDQRHPLVPPDVYWDSRAPKIDFHIGVALLPWSYSEDVLQASNRVTELGWKGCMDRVVVVTSASEAIHDFANHICFDAEMMLLTAVAPSIVRHGSFRFMAAVVDPIPVGH